jgi:DNA replication protein DnaC
VGGGPVPWPRPFSANQLFWKGGSFCARSSQVDHQSKTQRTSDPLHSIKSGVDVLLVDELGCLSLKPEQSNILFKLMEERHHRHATIITTNLSYDEWGNFLANPTIVDALFRRVRNYCHTIRIDGPSLRNPQG